MIIDMIELKKYIAAFGIKKIAEAAAALALYKEKQEEFEEMREAEDMRKAAERREGFFIV